MAQDAQTKEDATQLLVPKSCREMPLIVAQWDGKTLACLMARFYLFIFGQAFTRMSDSGVWLVVNVS